MHNLISVQTTETLTDFVNNQAWGQRHWLKGTNGFYHYHQLLPNKLEFSTRFSLMSSHVYKWLITGQGKISIRIAQQVNMVSSASKELLTNLNCHLIDIHNRVQFMCYHQEKQTRDLNTFLQLKKRPTTMKSSA